MLRGEYIKTARVARLLRAFRTNYGGLHPCPRGSAGATVARTRATGLERRHHSLALFGFFQFREERLVLAERFLASEAVLRPGDSLEAVGGNFLAAPFAYAVSPLGELLE